ncbi:glycine zipper domain-containing protein [Bauldia sp.]|uniref:glycine zipper domain-containing protein n=1 Tax=Bauldia sp. TaxID=2575872 RepID=UPI003BA9B92D
MRRAATAALVCMIGAAAVSGCMATRAERLAVVGGATGATVGAVASKSVGGAVIGGTAGAVAGYAIGKNTYRCWRTNIFGKRYRGWCIG